MNTASHERVRQERMRMSMVRRTLGAALEGEAAADNPVPVYLACSDYLKHALDRLHAQDHRLWERLNPHAGPEDAVFRDKLDKLKFRLAASEQSLAGLVLARDALRARGASEREGFEDEARRFLDVFLNILSASRHSTLAEGRGEVRGLRLGLRGRQHRRRPGRGNPAVRRGRKGRPRLHGFPAPHPAPTRPLTARAAALQCGHVDRPYPKRLSPTNTG